MELDLRVNGGGRDTSMPEIIAHSLHRQSPIEEMLGCGVAKGMRSTTLVRDPETFKTYRNNGLDHFPAERLDRGFQRQEHPPLGMRGAYLAEISQNRLSVWAVKVFVADAPEQMNTPYSVALIGSTQDLYNFSADLSEAFRTDDRQSS